MSPPDLPPPTAVDPELLLEEPAAGGHALAPVGDGTGRVCCLHCGAERKGKRWRARGAVEWSPFAPSCTGE